MAPAFTATQQGSVGRRPPHIQNANICCWFFRTDPDLLTEHKTNEILQYNVTL
jgi:hypothetical protein